MKIVLFALNSSFSHTNLAVRYLKNHIIENTGDKHQVTIIERNIKDKTDDVIFDLYSQKADMYGFSCYIFNVNEIVPIASAIKKLLPKCSIVFGGPEVSYDSDIFLSDNPFVDFIISGEGENALSDLIENGSGKKVISCEAFSDFEKHKMPYSIDDPFSGNIVYYESSRGCPYKCSYCMSSLTKGIRAKSVQRTLFEIKQFELFEDRVKIVKFVDRTFNYDMKRASEILEGLCDESYTKIYHIEIRPELCDERMFSILEKFPVGKLQIETGIQSTNEMTLDAISRPSDIKNAIKNIERIRSMGNIKVHCDLIAGLPYDNMDTIKSAYDSVFYICDELQLGFLKLLKGSKIRNEYKKHDYVFNDTAPYEVLSCRYLSYDEIYILKRIAALTERYKNSIHFTGCLEYLSSFTHSPFNIFSDLNEIIGQHISKINQHDVFKYLFDYAKSDIKNKMNSDEWSKFVILFRQDYKRCQNRGASQYFN